MIRGTPLAKRGPCLKGLQNLFCCELDGPQKDRRVTVTTIADG